MLPKVKSGVGSRIFSLSAAEVNSTKNICLP